VKIHLPQAERFHFAAFSHFSSRPFNSSAFSSFNYEHFKDSLLRADTGSRPDTSNIFDDAGFIPGKDSLQSMLERMDTQWRREAHLMTHLDSLRKSIRKEAGFTAEDKAIIRENIKEVDSFLLAADSVPVSNCSGEGTQF